MQNRTFVTTSTAGHVKHDGVWEDCVLSRFDCQRSMRCNSVRFLSKFCCLNLLKTTQTLFWLVLCVQPQVVRENERICVILLVIKSGNIGAANGFRDVKCDITEGEASTRRDEVTMSLKPGSTDHYVPAQKAKSKSAKCKTQEIYFQQICFVSPRLLFQ